MIVFFDVDDTLLDNTQAQDQAAWKFARHFYEPLGIEPDAFIQRWHTISQKHYRRYLAGEINFQGQRQGRMRDFFGADLSDAEADQLFSVYLGYYEESWTLFPDVVPALNALSYVTLGILTNGNPRQQRQKLERFGIADHFDVLVTPEDAGVSKPKPGIFQFACEQVNASPQECVYVGDQLEDDARAARAAGMRGVWLDRARMHAHVQDVTVIHALSELRGI